MPKLEQVPDEVIHEGDHIKVYIDFPDGSFDGCDIDEVKDKVELLGGKENIVSTESNLSRFKVKC